jgi:hypothetical protein
MRDKQFDSRVFGEKFWMYPDVLPDGRSYKEWYFDTYERGVWNIYNVYNLEQIKPFYLNQHDYYDIYRSLDAVTTMDRWEKYLQPGWNIKDIAALDGNAIVSKNVPIVLPATGFSGDKGHSYFAIDTSFVAAVESPFKKVREGATAPLKGTKDPFGYCDSGVTIGTRLDGKSEGYWWGTTVGNVKTVRFTRGSYLSQLSLKDKCEPLPGERVVSWYMGRAPLDMNNPVFCLSRGVVPGDFVKTYVNDEGKVYQMESWTRLTTGGDLLSRDRYRINMQRLNDRPGNGRSSSYLCIGRDVTIAPLKDDRVGVFEIDEWLRILRPLVMLQWASEFAMALSAGFVVYASVNGYYFLTYKLYHYIKMDYHWDPTVRYWCYWDHRNLDVKTLEWAYRGHMRDALLWEGSSYMVQETWWREHSLSSGYHLCGWLLRSYEWLDVFSSGVVW